MLIETLNHVPFVGAARNFPNTFCGSSNSTYSVDTEKIEQKGMRTDGIPTSEMK
jgi:hypothetical protein